jgi:hypothetical protein
VSLRDILTLWDFHDFHDFHGQTFINRDNLIDKLEPLRELLSYS